MFRAVAQVCVISACGFLGWGALLFLRTPAVEDLLAVTPTETQGEGILTIEDPSRDLGEMFIGEHQIAFRLVNNSPRPVEVIGGTSGCRSSCCFDFQNYERRSIRPGEIGNFTGNLGIHGLTAFEYHGAFYVNDGGQLRVVPFKLAGVGIQPKGKPNATPP